MDQMGGNLQIEPDLLPVDPDWTSYHDEVMTAIEYGQSYTVGPKFRMEARNQEGMTPLMNACMNRALDLCHFLLQEGASPNAVGLADMSALSYAFSSGQKDMALFDASVWWQSPYHSSPDQLQSPDARSGT